MENKSQCFFIQLDILEFYPSISENILDNAINQSLLYNNYEPWRKKDTDSCFDVTMGSYDGAEICELVET